MALNPIIAPDDDTTYLRVGSILALPGTVVADTRPTMAIIVSPENFTNYVFPRAWLEG